MLPFTVAVTLYTYSLESTEMMAQSQSNLLQVQHILKAKDLYIAPRKHA